MTPDLWFVGKHWVLRLEAGEGAPPPQLVNGGWLKFILLLTEASILHPTGYREHISCFMYTQSKRAGIIDFVRPPMNLRSNNKIKFKKGTKYRYAMHLKSPRVRGVNVWDILPSTVQKATTT